MSEKLLECLERQAQQTKPRFFAVCGVYKGADVEAGEDPTYIEWGLEFSDCAVAWSPGSTTLSDSADQILKVNARMGPAVLVWLEQ